jgi:hypothetical protein
LTEPRRSGILARRYSLDGIEIYEQCILARGSG